MDVFREFDIKKDLSYRERVDAILDELEFTHGKSFHRELMRKTAEQYIKCEMELESYDHAIRYILDDPNGNGYEDVPPKLDKMRQNQASRLERLSGRLGIDVSKIQRMAPKVEEKKEEEVPVLISYEDDEDYKA